MRAAGRHGSRHLAGASARRGNGQGVVEYGLILSLSAMLAWSLLVLAGGTVADVLDVITDAVDAAEGR